MPPGRQKQIEWLQMAQEKTGLTLNALAVLASVNPATLYRFRSGKSARLRAETIDRIGDVAGISSPFNRVSTKNGRRGEKSKNRSVRAAGSRELNLSVSAAVAKAADELGLNMSKAAEIGIESAIKQAQEEQWRNENRRAIKAYNERIEREGPGLIADWAQDLWTAHGEV